MGKYDAGYELCVGGAPVPRRPGYSASPEEVKAAIDRCAVVSFDIFDTLLCRSVLNGRALFRAVEARTGKPGFAAARVRAASAAEQERRDSPLRRIYEKLPEEFRGLADAEIRTEAQGLFPNPALPGLWKYCLEKGKRIIIVSDMYLSSAVLSSILEGKGYRGAGRVYVSNEYGTSKRRELFRKVLEEEKTDPGKILHFGDNPVRDGAVPLSLGLNVCLVRSPQARILRDLGWTRFGKYRRGARIGDVALGLCTRMAAREDLAADPWAMLGGALAGPLAVGFAERCVKLAERQGIKDIWFVARDGYLVKKAVETLTSGGLSCEYVYSPRTYSYLLAYGKADVKKHGLDRFLEMLNEAAPGFPSGRESRKLAAADKRKLILENWPLLDGERAEADARFVNYIGKLREKLGGERKILLVDGMSGQNSAEKLYRKYWNAPIVSLYLSCGNADAETRFSCYDGDPVRPLSFLEFFLSAPAPPVAGIGADGEPLFCGSPQHDRIISVFRRMEKGFDAFLAEYAALYPDAEGLFPVGEVTDWFNLYLDTLDDREMALFEDALLPGDSAESRFVTMADKIYKPFFRIGGAFKMQARKTVKSFVLRWFFRGRSHSLFRRIKN